MNSNGPTKFRKPINLVMDCAWNDLLQNFIWTWEELENGRIQGRMHGQEFLINHVLIDEQLGISKEGAIDATNVTFDEAKITLKKI